MIEIRKKKENFHQTIRNSHRQQIRARIRQNQMQKLKCQQVHKFIYQVFPFSQDWEEQRYHLWNQHNFLNLNYFHGADQFIHQTCHALRQLIIQYQKDQQTRAELTQWLMQNLCFILPPPEVQLDELPQPLVDLLIFLLQDKSFQRQDKQFFVDLLSNQTINRCLLNYFAENWNQIKKKKCNDTVMNLFQQLNKYINHFKKFIYKNQKLAWLLKEIIQQILVFTQKQIKEYDHLSLTLKRLSQKKNEGSGLSVRLNQQTTQQVWISSVDKAYFLIKNSIFLCHLLLMSPIPNFIMRQSQNDLRQIALYLHRQILIKEEQHHDKISVEFCLMVLLGATYATNQTNYLLIVCDILNLQIQRIKQKAKSQQFLDEQIYIDITILNNHQNIEYQPQSISSDETSPRLLNRLCLIMLESASQSSVGIKFDLIQKWLYYQLNNPNDNIFGLDNPYAISSLFSLLTNVVRNESLSEQNFVSYSYCNVRLKNKSNNDAFMAKFKIWKMITQGGFKQLIFHYNLIHYCKPLCGFIQAMIRDLDHTDDIQQSQIDQLIESEQEDSEQIGFCKYEKSKSQDCYLSTFKNYVYSLGVKFMDRSYNYLCFNEKQKIILNLMKTNYLGREAVRKYLTAEEIIIFTAQSYDSEDNMEVEFKSGDLSSKQETIQSKDLKHEKQKNTRINRQNNMQQSNKQFIYHNRDDEDYTLRISDYQHAGNLTKQCYYKYQQYQI